MVDIQSLLISTEMRYQIKSWKKIQSVSVGQSHASESNFIFIHKILNIEDFISQTLNIYMKKFIFCISGLFTFGCLFWVAASKYRIIIGPDKRIVDQLLTIYRKNDFKSCWQNVFFRHFVSSNRLRRIFIWR